MDILDLWASASQKDMAAGSLTRAFLEPPKHRALFRSVSDKTVTEKDAPGEAEEQSKSNNENNNNNSGLSVIPETVQAETKPTRSGSKLRWTG